MLLRWLAALIAYAAAVVGSPAAIAAVVDGATRVLSAVLDAPGAVLGGIGSALAGWGGGPELFLALLGPLAIFAGLLLLVTVVWPATVDHVPAAPSSEAAEVVRLDASRGAAADRSGAELSIGRPAA